MEIVVIGLGANLGDRVGTLRRAVQALRPLAAAGTTLRVAPIYESEALLPPDACPDWDLPFLNTAVLLTTSLEPGPVLDQLKAIEVTLGRQERSRWAPREIDMDVLAWGARQMSTERLTVPHAGLLERPFALFPLAYLWPDWVHPQAGQSARRLAAGLPFGSTSRCLRWGAGDLVGPQWVGILNITPDSFSDGGNFQVPEDALRHGRLLAAQGAAVLDAGAESTRPGSEVVPAETEWRRLAPVLEGLRETPGVLISLDTRHAEVARRGVQTGVDWLNDVTGFETPSMLDLAASCAADLVVMHSLGIPPSGERTLDPAADPVAQLVEWAGKRLEVFRGAGIAEGRLIFDPGIGFGKTAEQSLELIRRAGEFVRAMPDQVRVLYGHSRKSCYSLYTDAPATARDQETVAASLHLARQGVDYLRVHNPEAHRRAWRVRAEL